MDPASKKLAFQHNGNNNDGNRLTNGLDGSKSLVSPQPEGAAETEKRASNFKGKDVFQLQSHDAEDLDIFPRSGVFQNYTPGIEYEMKFLVKNISSKMAAVRISPPSTSAFRIDNFIAKTDIAPGLETHILVVFYSDEEKMFNDRVIVSTDYSSITIPLVAYVPNPEFVIPSMFDLGTVVAQPIISRYFELRNQGQREGKFAFTVDDNGNVSIYPKNGSIGPVSKQKVKILMKGLEQPGIHRGQVKLKLSNDDVERVLPVVAKVVNGRLEVMDTDTKNVLTALSFDTAYFGQKKTISTVLFNNSPFNMSYSITRVEEESDDVNMEDEPLPPAVSVVPSQGKLEPFGQTVLEFTFAPTAKTKTKGFKSAFKNLDDVEFFKEMLLLESVEMNQRTELTVTGKGIKPHVQCSAKKFIFGECAVGEYCDLVCTIRNDMELPIEFSLERIAHFHAKPSQGTLAPYATTNIVFTFQPNQLGQFQSNMFLVLGNNLKRIKLYMGGLAETISHKKSALQTIGGVDKVPEDFDRPLNYVHAKNETETISSSGAGGNAMGTMGANTRATDVARSSKLLDAQQLFESEASVKVYGDYVKRKENEQKFNEFIKQSREQKELALKLQQLDHLKSFVNDVDLALEPGAGLNSPKPIFHVKEEKLYLKDRYADSSSSLAVFKKQTKFDEEKLFKKKFKATPQTPNELKECQMKLTAKQMSKIGFGPKNIDFGKLSVFSNKVKNFGIRNDLKQYIMVTVGQEGDDIKIFPKSQVIPPLCTTGFDVLLFPTKAQKIQQALFLLVNEQHKIKFSATAEVIPLDVIISTEQLRFRFNEYSLDQSITETISITNKGSSTASWALTKAQLSAPSLLRGAHMDAIKTEGAAALEQPAQRDDASETDSIRRKASIVAADLDSIFTIIPPAGDLDPQKSQIIEITFTPSSLFRIEQQLRLHVKGSDSPKTLVCVGDIKEAKVACLEKKIDFGIISVGLKKQRTITLKNMGDTPVVFSVANLDQEFRAQPMRGRIPKGGQEKLTVEARPSVAREFTTIFDVIVRGGRPLRVPISGESKIPTVEMDGDDFIDFGSIFVGSYAKAPLTIRNTGSDIPAVLYLDLTEYSDFKIMNTRGDIITETTEGDDSIMVVSTLSDEDDEACDERDETDSVDEFGSRKELQHNSSRRNSFRTEEEEVAELSDEMSVEETGSKFQLTVAPNTALSFYLLFKPNLVREYDFKLPLALAGVSQAIDRQILARAMKPRVIISQSSIDFTRRVVIKENVNLPHRKLISFTNEDRKELLWEVAKIPDKYARIFRVEPSEGSLVPGQSAQLQIFFTPREMIDYEVSLPVYLDRKRDKCYTELVLRGMGSSPTLSFDRKEIIMPVVPLGTTTSEVFHVVNEGFDHLELKYRLPVDKEKIPLSVKFLDGQILGRDCTQIAIEVSFMSRKPTSFTSNIDFFDDEGNTFSIPVTCTADNCLFTIYPFMVHNKHSYQLVSDTGKSIMFIERKQGMLDSPRSEGSSSARTFSSRSGYTNETGSTSTVLSATEKMKRKLFNKKAADRLLGWLNMNVLKNPVDDLIKSILFTNGGTMYEIILSLVGKAPPGKLSSIPSNKLEACKALYGQYDELLKFLRGQGALLHDIKPLLLLKYEDYLRMFALMKQQQHTQLRQTQVRGIQGQPSGQALRTALSTNKDPQPILTEHDDTSGEKKMTEKRFKYASHEAWLTIIYQLIKIFVLQRITLPGFKKLPGVDEKYSNRNDPTISTSNIYSTSENIILKWMSYHYNKVYPPKEGEDPHRIISFGSTLNDCKVFAALLQSHIPMLANRFDTFLHKLNDIGDFEHNASLVINVLKECRLDYNITLRDIVRADPINMLMFCTFLYQNLPSFVPRSTILFEGNLLEKLEKTIELTNPTRKSIEYVVTREGSDQFNVHAESITLKPMSKEMLYIDVTPKFMKVLEGRVVLHGQRIGTFKPATMVFALQTKVQSNNFVKTFEVSTVVFELARVDVTVENPFPRQVQLNISLEQTSQAKKDESSSFIMPDAFWSYADVFVLKQGETKVVQVHFLPFTPNAEYRCKLLFSDPKVGEFVYLIKGKSVPPQPTEEFRIIAEAKKSEEKGIPIMIINPTVDKAFSILRERQKKSRQPANAMSVIPAELNQIEYKVSTSSPYFKAPDTFTLHRKLASSAKPLLPVVFAPKTPGQYEALLVLDSPYDYRILKLVGRARSEGIKAEMEFSAPCRQKVIQEIPINNRSDKTWKVQAIVEGDAFIGPTEVRIPAGKVASYPLTFRPIKRGTYQGTLTLNNSDTLERFIYELTGTSEDPRSEGTIKLECKARSPLTHKITIQDVAEQIFAEQLAMANQGGYTGGMVTHIAHGDRNYSQQRLQREGQTRYKVSFDLPFIKGEELVAVDRGKSTEYSFTINPPLGGKYTGSATFTDAVTGEYMWYVLQIEANRSPAENKLSVNSIIRETKFLEIDVANPLDQPITFEVTIEGTCLEGEPIIKLKPLEKTKYKLTFRPLYVGEQKASISFYNEICGEFWYEIQARSEEAPPVVLPEMKCEVGRTAEHRITVQNPIDAPLILSIESSNPQNFQVSPASLSLSGFQSGTFVVSYLPSSISNPETTTITVQNKRVGAWVYQCEGIGMKPTEMDKTVVYAQVRRMQSAVITWRNPFPMAKKIKLSLISNRPNVNQSKLTDGVFHVISKRFLGGQVYVAAPFSSVQIPFSFTPEVIAEYHIKVSVNIVGEDLSWRFPIHGITEVQTGEAFTFATQARTSLQKVIELTLVGVPNEEDGKNKSQYSHRLVFPEQHQFLKAIKRSLNLQQVTSDEELAPNTSVTTAVFSTSASESIANSSTLFDDMSVVRSESSQVSVQYKKLRFKVEFGPLRPFTGLVELFINRSNGGVWKYELQLEATAPEVDDTIEIQCSIGKTERVSFRLNNIFAHAAKYEACFSHDTPLDFSVFPDKGSLAPYGYEGTQFVISYTANSYGTVVQGTLIIDTEEMQWQYALRGVMPAYRPPDKNALQSRIENQLDQ